MEAHETGGLWLLREMWGFPAGVPEDERLDYLKAIMVCARAKGELTPGEKEWVIGYGAACGAPQATVDALEAYNADEDIEAILQRNMPTAQTWGRVVLFDAIRAASADHDYDEGEMEAIRSLAQSLGVDEGVVADLEALSQDEAALRRRRIELVFGEQVPYQERA